MKRDYARLKASPRSVWTRRGWVLWGTTRELVNIACAEAIKDATLRTNRRAARILRKHSNTKCHEQEDCICGYCDAVNEILGKDRK